MTALFPIGTMAAASDAGTIDSVSYSLFEPNAKCDSQKIFYILTSQFENKSMMTRKKASPYMSISYEYENIFTREYRQLEHFVKSVDDALTSFYVVDFSKGFKPSSVTESSGDWVIAITNTYLFSTAANYKSYYALVSNGRGSYKFGSISAISANTSVTLDVDTLNYGALSSTTANSSGILFPVYECYFTANSINNFKSGSYVNETIGLSTDGGFLYSGNLSFISKYPV